MGSTDGRAQALVQNLWMAALVTEDLAAEGDDRILNDIFDRTSD